MFTLKNNTVSFQIKYDCNKRCGYCSLDKEQYTFSDKELIKNFHIIFHKIDAYMRDKGQELVPSIVGGEPTYWDYEFQEAILNEIKSCKKYLLFTNGFDMLSPLFRDEKAVPYVHIIDYTDLNKVSFILDKIKETNKKEWYVCTVVTHLNTHYIKEYLKFMKEKKLFEHVYLQPCDHTSPYYRLTEEEWRDLEGFCDELGYVKGELNNKYMKKFSPQLILNCWENRSLNVDLVANKIYGCNHKTYAKSLDDIYNISKYLENQKIPCIDYNCQSPIHAL